MGNEELFDLKGKVAIITGGGRGLGKQIAEAFADAGCHIVLCSRKIEACHETVEQLKNKGVNALALSCDVTNKEDVDRTVEAAINQFEKVDILVNNSGTTWGAPVEDMPEEAWNKVMNVNVKGTFLMSQKVGQHMIPRKTGKIINISSVAGIKAEPSEVLNAIGYSTSKAAVIHMTKDLAMKWAQYGINVNSIAPGFFQTKMTNKVLEERGEKVASHIPLGRIGDDTMLKGAALFLASKASDFVTGHILTVDGGAHL
ncbi:SDR family oxidoreductase [Alkalihalophilus sp. As8PL]|uniref:SDR family oxidoreductase n=1 Tax=Alkalihalophilus sp. As8PL TaxID=3237103 RepID=A0AB39BWE5_9BACI